MPRKLQGEASIVYKDKIPGVFDSCESLRDVVVKTCEELNFSFTRLTEIEVAVGEACINIVEHGYSGRKDCPIIAVVVTKYDDGIEIILLDGAESISPITTMPSLTPETFVEQQRTRGLGISMIRTCVDYIEHEFLDGKGNKTVMTKFIEEEYNAQNQE